jgi:hypothetical protein
VDAPTGATFSDHGDGTGTFRWTPASTQVGEHVLRVQAEADGITDSLPVRLTVRMTGDDIEDAIPIARLPFTDTRDIGNATTSDDEPACLTFDPGIWYVLRPAVDSEIDAVLADHAFNASVSVYSGSKGALQQIVCGDDHVRFTALAGVAYYILVRDADHRVSLSVTGRRSLTVGVDKVGSFDPRTGRAAVAGSVTCASPGVVTIEGRLTQSLGPARGEGEFTATVFCSDRSRWTATVVPTSGAFRAGPASVSLTATSTSGEKEDVEIRAQASGTVRLLGRPRRF